MPANGKQRLASDEPLLFCVDLLNRTRHRNVVNPRDVFAHEFGANVGREGAEIAGYDFAGFGPGGVAVRKVVGPHAVILTPPRQDMTADGVVKERGVDLFMKVFARRLGDI
jgi:hypothetical protein